MGAVRAPGRYGASKEIRGLCPKLKRVFVLVPYGPLDTFGVSYRNLGFGLCCFSFRCRFSGISQ